MFVHRGAALVHDALDVGDEYVLALGAEFDEEIDACQRGGACARTHDADVFETLAG